MRNQSAPAALLSCLRRQHCAARDDLRFLHGSVKLFWVANPCLWPGTLEICYEPALLALALGSPAPRKNRSKGHAANKVQPIIHKAVERTQSRQT